MTTEHHGIVKRKEFLKRYKNLVHIPSDALWRTSDDSILASKCVTDKEHFSFLVIKCDASRSMTGEMQGSQTCNSVSIVKDFINSKWFDLEDSAEKFEENLHCFSRGLSWFFPAMISASSGWAAIVAPVIRRSSKRCRCGQCRNG